MMKQGYDICKLDKIITDLVNEIPLPPLNRDHGLIGDYSGCRECHIQGDWLLIYKYKDDTVIFLRTGSHSELF
jgi:mRNA interferase YafQ